MESFCVSLPFVESQVCPTRMHRGADGAESQRASIGWDRLWCIPLRWEKQRHQSSIELDNNQEWPDGVGQQPPRSWVNHRTPATDRNCLIWQNRVCRIGVQYLLTVANERTQRKRFLMSCKQTAQLLFVLYCIFNPYICVCFWSPTHQLLEVPAKSRRGHLMP